MRETVISVENVSKLYRLGEVGTGSLAHDVNRWWHRVRGKEDPYRQVGETNDREQKGDSDYAWALRGVSFQVKQGEVLGIIGKNGAGKSTLLKILSRVTTQTEGRIKIKGRIASLLEVGTGFHPELTGRENIFLNGAILGMRKAEIARKFDEIVEFSGCARYIDTPVKRYSSGMYVRLAFAVAAHLEPEILIVDEVLAVGDAEFQKKCLGKMKDVAGHGRTVLFVSHNMDAVMRLCERAILVEKGRVSEIGNTASVVAAYHKEEKRQSEVIDLRNLPREGTLRARVRLVDVQMEGKEGSHWKLPYGLPLGLIFTIEARVPIREFELGIGIFSANGVEVASALSTHDRAIDLDQPGLHKVCFRYPDLRLVSRQYHFGAGIRSDLGMEDYIREAFTLEIVPTTESASSKADTFGGFVVPRVQVSKV